jgi:hypothetical protein
MEMPGGHPKEEIQSDGSGPTTPDNSSKYDASNPASPFTPPNPSANSTTSTTAKDSKITLDSAKTQ